MLSGKPQCLPADLASTRAAKSNNDLEHSLGTATRKTKQKRFKKSQSNLQEMKEQD